MLLRSYVNAKVGWGDFRVRLRDRLVAFAGSERGGVAAEYALLVSLIAIVLVVGAFALGQAINNRLNDTATCVSGAPSPTC
jgi:Flp pilus assembly pilin Flp